ncbi:hypothetical protein OIDMADRAFT_183252 [Oidiodendron maius Zn]|uniref:Uncharacterized protein n=1 Tax=Oidiodendron maius (strain Zn) TaxID=913774 RepID=A0A0C3H1V3_OIDMZ|nr:hypothetical protein OIDMADRAFT_183252 [Oidiodendron maius Zn]
MPLALNKMCTVEYPSCNVHPNTPPHVQSLCPGAKGPFTCGNTTVFPRQGSSESFCSRCNEDAPAKTMPDIAIVALSAYANFTLLSSTVISEFKDIQSTIQKSQQEIQEARDACEQAVILMRSVPWQDQAEAQQASEMLRSAYLGIQEMELAVQEQSLRLVETIPVLNKLEINSNTSMGLLTMCLREAITDTSNQATGS